MIWGSAMRKGTKLKPFDIRGFLGRAKVSQAQAAKDLGLNPRTIRHYVHKGLCPQHVKYALFSVYGPGNAFGVIQCADEPDKKARRIERLPPSSHFTPAQAIAYAQQTIDAGNLKDVMVVGWRPDGKIYSISSHMSREWALWLLHELMDNVRQVNRYSENN